MNPDNRVSGKPDLKKDFLASIVVFLVALPLCMGVAIASGAPVSTGLITGIVGGIVVGLLAGCPMQVSGPAAGLTVIVYEYVTRYGIETLGTIVLVAGVMQILAGVFRLGQWFRAVSPAVIQGMLAGIGVLILASQFHVMMDQKVKGKGLANLVGMPESLLSGLSWPGLESRDLRVARQEILRGVGELHRRQVRLRETVAEAIPHAELEQLAQANSLEKPDTGFVSELEAEQLRMLESLASEESRIRETDTGDRLQRSEESLAAAKIALQKARSSLAEWSPTVLKDMEDAAATLEALLATQKNHHWAAIVGLSTIVLIVLWKTLAPKKLQLIPPPLFAIVVTTVIAAIMALPVAYVEVPDNLFSEIHFPSLTLLSGADWAGLLQAAAVIAIVASAETLLCCTAVDQMHTGPRTQYDKELWAQGAGNTICGFLGALPMTGVIVRSTANVQAGATSRFSAILHGVWLLVFVVILSSMLRLIPLAGLAAILVYTGYKLVNIQAIRKLAGFGWSEVLIYLATVIMIVATDLLTGVITGIVLAALKLLYTFSHLETQLVSHPTEPQITTLKLNGAATFIRLPVLASSLEEVPPAAELHVDFEHLDYIDHACLDLLMNWARQHESLGGRLVIDWSSLHARFRGENGSNLKADA
jgi:MFS superfamily sulfate permease-like transporter